MCFTNRIFRLRELRGRKAAIRCFKILRGDGKSAYRGYPWYEGWNYPSVRYSIPVIRDMHRPIDGLYAFCAKHHAGDDRADPFDYIRVAWVLPEDVIAANGMMLCARRMWIGDRAPNMRERALTRAEVEAREVEDSDA